MRPAGVTAIAILLFAVSAYLTALGFIRLASPESISLSLGAPLLHGLEISGPYVFLVVAGIGLLFGYGLLRLQNPARRPALLLAPAGIVLLIPTFAAHPAQPSLSLLTA